MGSGRGASSATVGGRRSVATGRPFVARDGPARPGLRWSQEAVIPLGGPGGSGAIASAEGRRGGGRATPPITRATRTSSAITMRIPALAGAEAAATPGHRSAKAIALGVTTGSGAATQVVAITRCRRRPSRRLGGGAPIGSQPFVAPPGTCKAFVPSIGVA